MKPDVRIAARATRGDEEYRTIAPAYTGLGYLSAVTA
jgi:hypothetical protein